MKMRYQKGRLQFWIVFSESSPKTDDQLDQFSTKVDVGDPTDRIPHLWIYLGNVCTLVTIKSSSSAIYLFLLCVQALLHCHY